MADCGAHAHEDGSQEHHGDGEDSSHHNMTNQDWLDDWEKGDQWELSVVDQ